MHDFDKEREFQTTYDQGKDEGLIGSPVIEDAGFEILAELSKADAFHKVGMRIDKVKDIRDGHVIGKIEIPEVT